MQDGNGITDDSKENPKAQEQQQELTTINMSGGENSADAVHAIGSGGNGGRGDSGDSGGSGPKTTSAVTTLVSNGSATLNNSNVSDAPIVNTKSNTNNHSEVNIKQNIRNRASQESDEDDIEGPSPAGVTPRGFWGVYDRPPSRGGSPTAMDNMSEVSSQPPVQPILPRSKSRTDMTTTIGSASGALPVSSSTIGGSASNIAASGRITNQLSFWKARCITFYRNGDPFFNGLEFRFKPGRDISNLERLLDKISTRMDLPRGARYIFSMDGDRKYSLDELEDGASYVVSSYKQFKVSRLILLLL